MNRLRRKTGLFLNLWLDQPIGLFCALMLYLAPMITMYGVFVYVWTKKKTIYLDLSALGNHVEFSEILTQIQTNCDLLFQKENNKKHLKKINKSVSVDSVCVIDSLDRFCFKAYRTICEVKRYKEKENRIKSYYMNECLIFYRRTKSMCQTSIKDKRIQVHRYNKLSQNKQKNCSNSFKFKFKTTQSFSFSLKNS